MNVQACMATHPISVRPDTRLADALELMTAYGARHLPVIDGQHRFVGIIRHHHVRAALSEPGEDTSERGVLTITELGTPTLSGDESVEAAWALLGQSPGFTPLPVVMDGRLEGTISHHELLRAMADLPPDDPANAEAGSPLNE
jgi:CBS domain-containing protein